MIRYLFNATTEILSYERDGMFPYLTIEPGAEFVADMETYLMIQQDQAVIKDVQRGAIRVGYESGKTYPDTVDSLLCLLDKLGDTVYIYDPMRGVIKISPEIITDPDSGVRGPNMAMGIFMSLEDVFKNKTDPIFDKLKADGVIKKNKDDKVKDVKAAKIK